MAAQKRISDYVLKPVSKVGSNASSSAIVIVDSSDGIDDEEVIEDDKSFRDISHSPPASFHKNPADNTSERAHY